MKQAADKIIKVSVTAKEHATLERKAGESSLSAFIRRALGLCELARGGTRKGAGRKPKEA